MPSTEGTSDLTNAIVVAGHAPFKEIITDVPSDPERDEPWVLQSFQIGEPPLYIAHARRGVALLRTDPRALLIFSGGYTRREAGLRWSEAETYRAIAQHYEWWNAGAPKNELEKLDARTATEDYSRDSFENLLFSICRFQQVTRRYPERVTLISWRFKRERFDLHRATIRFPVTRFVFEGFNDPIEYSAALDGEAITLAEFRRNRYGSNGRIAEKRLTRNPFLREHDFRFCPGLREFFAFIEDPGNRDSDYPARLPWE
jgi:hypothetical protein